MRNEREELVVDEQCARCASRIIDTESAVRRDGDLYCCANCARAALGETTAPGEACAHCGAPVVERATAVTENARLYCCASCAAAPAEVEPPVG